MKFKTLMIIKAVVCLVFGLGLMFLPDFIYGILGTSLTDGGRFAAREYASAMLGLMLITWFGQNAHESDIRMAVILGLCVYDAIGFVVTTIVVLTGVLNALGWLIAALYLFLAVGFGYFLIKPPKP